MTAFTPTALTRQQADLLAGGLGLPAVLSDDDWTTLLSAAEIRLLAALCRETAPTPDDPNYPVWKQLLANYVKALLEIQRAGILPKASKSVRNYSVSYGNNGKPVLTDFYAPNADAIAMFSQCGSGVAFQSNWSPFIYGPDDLDTGDLLPDAPPLLGGAI